MALTFFWRCESTTLSGTDDYTAGASSVTLNGTASLSGTAAKIGSNGILNTDGADYYYFSPTSLITGAEGAIGYWLQYPTTGTGSGSPAGFLLEQNDYTATDNWVRFEWTAATNGNLRLAMRKAGTAQINLDTSGANLNPGNWYFCVGAWDTANNKRYVAVYNSTGTLLAENEDTSTSLTNYTSIPSDRINFGACSSNTNVVYVDNVFLGSAYGDTALIVTNRDITSYTSWSTGTTKYLKLLASSAAQSDTGVSGVVFDGTGYTTGDYLGAFSGKSFESSLESGSAVLKVPVADFGGSALTTSSTPVAFIWNSTDAGIGPADCTVIEE